MHRTAAYPASETELAPRLRLAVMRLARRLRQHGQEVVTASQFSALVCIDYAGPISLGDLAELEHVQPPTMTRIVRSLERLDLVHREVRSDDRRVVQVRVTQAGRRLVEHSRKHKTAYLASRLRRFGPEDLEVLERASDLLERMVEEES